MWSYVRGFRRKSGCVMLAAALLLMGMWLRSYVKRDTIAFGPRRSLYYLASHDAYVSVVHYSFPTPEGGYSVPQFEASPLGWLNVGWWSDTIEDAPGAIEPWKPGRSESHWAWYGFVFGTSSFPEGQPAFRKAYAFIPCWSVVLPLSLASAYLLVRIPPGRGAVAAG